MCLLFVQKLALNLKLVAELFVRGAQSLNHIEILNAMIAKDLTTRPDVPSEVVVEQKREGFLLLKLTVQCASQVSHLRLHASKRLEEHVRVATEQIAKVNGTQVAVVLLNQLELPTDHVLPILEGQLWEVIKHGHDLRGLNLVIPFQVVEQANQIGRLATE